MTMNFVNVIADLDQEYPDWKTYHALYARYQKRPVGALIDVYDRAQGLTGKHVLDLCGGAGKISEECVIRGAAQAFVVDENTKMVNRIKGNRGIKVFVGKVGEFLEHAKVWYRDGKGGPDVVFCRQAVNYWMDTKSVKALAKLMEPGSIFIFNTFNQKPPSEPHIHT